MILNQNILKKNKAILFFNDSLVLAGTEKMLVLLLNHLVQEQKAIVTLLLPYPSDQDVLLTSLDERVIVNYLFEEPKEGFAKKWAEIKMIFKAPSFIKNIAALKADYDLIVCFKEGFYANLFAALDKPKILWIHNIIYKRSYKVRSLKEKWAVWLNKKEIKKTYSNYEQYNKILCVSHACKQAYIDILFDGQLPIQDIRVLPNSLIVNDILAKSVSDETLYSPCYTNFVLVTRDSPDKAPERILTIAQQLKSEGIENIKIHVIGLTGNEDIITGFEGVEELNDILVFYGNIENPYPYIQQADWLLCVSDRESFSLSVLEAMILNTPVISTNCGGPSMLLDKGKLGLLTSNDVASLYEAVKNVAADPGLKQPYKGNQQFIREKYDIRQWYTMVDKILGI